METRPLPSLTIDRRFCGAPDAALGGYAAGLLAAHLEGPVEVALRRPPPVGAPLAVEKRGRALLLGDGEGVIAEARSSRFDLELCEPVSFADADSASAGFPWIEGHPFPGCFGCGPGRATGDGLRVFPGPLDGRDVVCAPWVPDDGSLADAHGMIRPEIVWAALDCPTGIALRTRPGWTGVATLARLAVSLTAPVEVGERYVVVAWPLDLEPADGIAGAALLTESGDLRAVARATWIKAT